MTRSDVGHPIDRLIVHRYEVLRYSSGEDSTLGLLFRVSPTRRRFLAFTLEDEARMEKIHGETRIPAGTYQLQLRTEGGFHARYARRFPAIHEGMIHVLGVPGFEWVLWHIGNDDDDTAGCLLLADRAVQNVTESGRIISSEAAYRRVYPLVRNDIHHGRTVVTYVDYDGDPSIVQGAQ